ncbi:hypothetical protein LTR37_009804 [Vermiconidia calcicola]|uniref:Uncharacterized protein n=1 Tax=Vermiconidia calcicola TaxID=1690605 RepID=A0ACC3N816_9PEZI|nr:hypothetical protein LTR37_009804 [Vermiconidia calcicola]
MSDDEHTDSSSEGEDVETTGLIATRAKRATAGNLYATLRANLDDEELQKELLAEDEEEDAADYEGSDKDAGDDDDALESSSDEEDAGPPRDYEEDLEGEKVLKKQERAEAKKKRKVHEARLKLPAWREQQKKKVKLADDVKAEDGSAPERPKKKSERSNWLPTAADAPIRQSGRSLAVANREVVHANLKQSAQRSEKQRRIMKNAAEREVAKRRMTDLSQEDRFKKCERIERETAKEFGRWEREEAERQRLREEALAAKRNRGLDGPVIRHWSGSVLWEGERIKVRRVEHGSRKVEEIMDERRESVDGQTSANEQRQPASNAPSLPSSTPAGTQTRSTPEPVHMPAPPQAAPPHPPGHENLVQAPVPWLQGIQEYAAQPEATPAHPPSQHNYTPSAPSISGPPNLLPPQQQHPQYPPPPQMYHGWPPGSHQFAVQPQPLPPPPPLIPLIREQARRILVILESFPSLENNGATKRIPKSKQQPETGLLEPSPVIPILLPSTLDYPSFTPEESRYLTSRPRRRNNEVPLPLPPAKQRCAVTSWPAKFRDPKTGLAYADMHQYKVIQRVLAGGCQWSALLGCWVGPSYGVMGRAAKGVPDGFAGTEVKHEV